MMRIDATIVAGHLLKEAPLTELTRNGLTALIKEIGAKEAQQLIKEAHPNAFEGEVNLVCRSVDQRRLEVLLKRAGAKHEPSVLGPPAYSFAATVFRITNT